MAFNLSKLSRVVRKKNPNYQKNGFKSYGYVLQKYNICPTVDGPFTMVSLEELPSSQSIMEKFIKRAGRMAHSKGKFLVKKDATGALGFLSAEDIQFDDEYLAEVDIGTPAQTFNLDFDTGSADLWVWSTELSTHVQAQGQKTGHAIFDMANSSSWKWSEDPATIWKIQYADGSYALGDVGYDTITVGGLAIQNQAIETAKEMSLTFQTGTGDGMLGLAFGIINTVTLQDKTPAPVATPVENMISQNDVPKNAELFTAHLGSWRDSSNSEGQSFYTFGYIDQDVVDASGQEINYVDVDIENGWFQFPSTKAAVNGKGINRSGNTAIADTGTSLALVDDDTCEAIYSAIPNARQVGQGQWIFPSSTPSEQLPTVQLAVGSQLFNVNKEDLAYGKAENGMYYGGIQSRGSAPFDIFGDTVLKSIYAIFDQGNKRFGCVQRSGST